MKIFGKITRAFVASLMIINMTTAFVPKTELPFEAEEQTTENSNTSNENVQPEAVEQSEGEEETPQEDNEQSDSGNQINVPATFAEPADWAFQASSRPLEQAILSQYRNANPRIDSNNDGYISRAEANQYVGNISLLDQGITGTIDGIEYFVSSGEINLSGNNLTGNIPENIGALNRLTLLHLNGNQLSGPIPTSIDRLTSLTRLNLGHNNLSGKIPDSLTTLRSTNFRLLALDNNNFTDLSQATYAFINRVSVSGTRQGFLNNQTNTLSLEQAGRIYDDYSFAAYPAYSQFPSYDTQSRFVYELTLPNGTRRTITPTLAANGSTLTIRGTDLTQPGRYQLNASITAANAVFTGTVYTTNFDVVAVNQTVNFETDTDTPIAPQEVLKGSYITDPRENIVLEKEGYIFDGWYRDAARTIRWNFATNPVMENVTLYAKWNPAPYNVIFDFNNGVDASIQNAVLFGANITAPEKDPTKIGHTFVGWFTALEGGEKWNFTEQTMPARDVNLYAQYTPNTYTITFNYNNGTADKTEGIFKFGETITAPESPIKAGHTFIGWYTALEGGEKWDFTNQTMPAGNVTLYAHYLETVYNIEAHDFVLSFAELEEIVNNKETEIKFIDYAGVRAYDITLPDDVKELGVSLSSEVRVATGVQAVTFTTGGGVTKTVNVYVYNVLEREAGEAINAHDFAIALDDVSVENFIAYAKAEGYDVSTLPGSEVSVSVTSALPTTTGTYDVTFATVSGNTIMTVKAYVYNTVNREAGEAINAADFAIALDEVNRENFIASAKAVGYDISALPGVEVSVSVTSVLPTTIGTYDVTFATASGNAIVTVKAYVYNKVDRETNEAINAHDFTIPLRLVNEANFRAYSEVQAYRLLATPEAVTLQQAPEAVVGAQAVTFSTASGTSITVTANVIATNVSIEASDIVMSLAEAQATSGADLLARTGAKATTTNSGATTSVGISTEDVAKLTGLTTTPSEAISIQVIGTDDQGDGAEKAINVYVYNTVNRETNEALNAADFAIALDEVSEANFIAYANAKGYDVSTLPGSEVSVGVTSVLPTTIGTYDVTFATASGDATVTVQAYVYNKVDRETNEAINAHDFTIPLNLVNETNFISYSEVSAYDISTLPSTPIIGLNMVSELPKSVGTYDVTFVTPNDKTFITVKATVLDTNITIHANDIFMTLEDAWFTTAADLLERTQAEASTTNANAVASVAIAETEVNKLTMLERTVANPAENPIQIIINASDTSGDSTQKTVNVYVFKAFNEGFGLNARDFAIALKDVSEENIFNYSEARVYNLTTMPPSQFGRARLISPLPDTTGVFDILFVGPGNNEISVSAYVYDIVNPVDPSRPSEGAAMEAMIAENFAIALKDVSAENFIAHSFVKAYDIANLPDVEIEGVYLVSPLPTEIGLYDATFATPSGKTTITVQSYVYDVLSEDAQEAINAHDFAIALDDVSEANFIAYAEAKGYDVSTVPGKTVDLRVASVLPTTTGTYDVTFETASGNATMSVKAYVYNKVDRETQEALSAEDFTIALDDVSEANFITYANAKGYDVSTLPGSEVAGVTVRSMLPTTTGVHDVTFATASGNTTMTVKAYVYNTVNRETNEALSAADFTIALDDVSEANFIAYANAKGYDVSTLPGSEVPVSVTSTLPTMTGTYDVTFATASGNTTMSVKAYVYNTVNKETQEALSAADFAIALDEVSEANFIAYANAKGYDVSTLPGAEVSVSVTSTLPTITGTYDVTFATASGNTTMSVKAYVYNTVNKETQEAINAEDFAIALDDVSEANFITYAKAKGYDVSTLPGAEVLVNVTSTLPTVTGTYDVTFATASGNTTVTVKAYVYNTVNKETQEAINAADFAIALGDVSEANFIVYANAKGYDVSTLPESEVSVSVTSALPTTIGTYDITFATASGNTTMSVKAYVYNTVNRETNEAINAHDFTIPLRLVNEANFRAYSEVEAYRLLATPEAVIMDTIPEPIVGEQAVTFSTASGTSITVTATVVATNVSIEASDIVMSLAEAQATSGADLLARTGAKATTTNEGATTSVGISVEDVTKLTGLTTTPNEPISIQVIGTDDQGDGAEKAINVYVYDTVNRETNEAISAEDFAIALDDVSEANFIAYAKAKGYDVSTLPGVEVSVNVTSALPTTIGTYDVTFATASGNTSVTVKAYVYNTVNRETNEALSAEDFAIALDEVNEENFITYANAKGYDISTLPGAEVSVNVTSTLPTTTGTYDVTFATASGNTSATVKAYVYNTVNRETNEALSAEDFAIALDEVSEENFIAYANAKGYDISTLPATEVSVSVTSALPRATGTYDVTFATASGNTTMSVKAYVYNTVNRETNEALSAEDFAIALDEVSEENFITYAKAKGYDISTLPATEVPVSVTSALPTTTGTYDVTFATASGDTTVTVKAYVYNTVNRETNEALSAEDFAIALDEVSEENFIAYANAKGYDISTLPATEVSVSVTSALPRATGTYDVTFATASGNTTVTVKAYVYNTVNRETNEALSAGDFAIALDEVSAENFITYANAKGYDISTLPATEVPVSVISVLPTTSGTHDVTFATASGNTTMSVKAHVYNTINKETQEAIDAEDFTIALDEVSAENFIVYANAKGYDIINLPASEIAVNVTSTLPTTTGTYDVTFATTSGNTTMSVKAYVYNTVNRETNEAISAADFAIALGEVSEANFIAYAKAKGYDITNLPASEIAVNVTSVLPTTTGTYDVTFATASGNTTMSVKAHVYDTVNRETNEAINAHDFVIPLPLVSNENFIAYAEAQGYDITKLPGAEVPVSVTSALPTAVGEYDVIFTTEKGTTMTVKATIIATNITVNAEDISLSLAEAQTISEEDLLTYVKAAATTTNDNAEVSVTITSSEMNKLTQLVTVPTDPVAIDVTAIDSSGDSNKKTVNIYVYNVVNQEQKQAMNAEDFTIALSEVSVENFIAYANVKGYDVTALPGTELDVTLLSDLPTVSGEYDITFGIKDSVKNDVFTMLDHATTITVKSTIIDDTKTIAVSANDIRLSVVEFNGLQQNEQLEATILQKSNAQALVVETGERLAPLHVDMTHILGINVVGGEVFDVDIYYETPSELTQLIDAETPSNRHIKTIKLVIEKPVKLPITGGYSFEMIVIGALLSILSMIFLIVNKKKRSIN